MELEDLNHGMLRAAYAFHLLFYFAFVLVAGLVLIPFGYVAVLVVRLRLVLREWRMQNRREGRMGRRVQDIEHGKLKRAVQKFFLFLVTGVL